ncbi:membrane-bound lytic murein transglycosylase B [Actinoalloteichus sp. GBA129-24]|uniref:Membrane-bound lytic murein transglycosylase B n=1 Tax=Actinoalloteichus fjordicus TaxID=1612552 RepID=A0AAC9L835_9PSEU|nr:membrane-bound lytic murein transglycosylase B [Actinoalloteichus fjordicus]APU18794.1 membrane-bound lytic murein transglycosylase B [Actinoalloteichus sp. GBA129-24]
MSISSSEPEPSPEPPARGRWTRFVVAVVGLAVIAVVVNMMSAPDQGEGDRLQAMALAMPRNAPPDRGAAVPEVAPVDHLRPMRLDERPQEQLADWADSLADPLNIPRAALEAYGYAAEVVRMENPDCGITWTVLAGIGLSESNHGRFAGATLDETGRPSTPIIGLPLDGSPGVKEIRDTDGGELDGDTVYDRAVGPMQFIPTTWKRWGADADGDGVADPQDLDDAALTAARYLCHAGGDLTESTGWWRAVLTYNESRSYAEGVLAQGEEYGRMSRAVLSND